MPKPELHPHQNSSPVNLTFRIGKPDLTIEEIYQGKRYLGWLPTEVDNSISAEAGWKKFNRHQEGGVSYLQIPEGTRSASSVLSGKEAWGGEKKEVLDFVLAFTRATLHRYAKVDTSLTLDSVGVTKDERIIFATPPHVLSGDKESIEAWAKGMVKDLASVLAVETRRDELVDYFFREITDKTGGGHG